MRYIIGKYSALSKPAKASIWFAVCSIIQRGIAMITTPIFTRILTTEEYGRLSVYNSWLAIITIFATFELAVGVFNKAMIKYEKDRDGYTSSILILSSLCTFILFVIYLIFNSFWNNITNLDTTLIAMMFVDILFTQAMQLMTARRRFEFEYKSVVAVTLLANIIGSVLSVVLVINSKNNRVEMKIFGTLLIHIMIYGIIFIGIMLRGKRVVNLRYWKYALTYNMPLIPHYLSQQVLNQSDRIMISRMVGLDEAALYSVAYTLATLMNIITNAIHSSFTPWAFQCIKSNDHKKIGKIANSILLAMASVCFVFTLFAPEAIMILGGEKYYQAIWVIPPVAMSVVFIMLYSIVANYAMYFEKTSFMMIGTVCSAVVNVLLNSIFIPAFGFLAAGYTTLVCYIIYSIVHYLFMLKICKDYDIDNPFDTKVIWSIAVFTVILSIVSSMLYNNTVLRYIIISLMAIVILIFRKKIGIVIEVMLRKGN